MHPKSLLFVLVALVLVLGLGLRSPAYADDTSDAKAHIGQQLALIKAGDVDGLKAGFTDRLKEKITAEQVNKAKGEISKYPLDELVGSVESKPDGIKVKMKNGRTLTTLVKVNGAWKADTIWFK